MNRVLAAAAAVTVAWMGVAPSVANAQLKSELVASGLTLPLGFIQDPSDPSVQVILQQDGRVRLLKNGALQQTDFLDLRSQTSVTAETGLLGLAFAPDYAASRRFYVNFTNLLGDTVVARFLRSAADPLRADPATRFDLLWPSGERFIRQPFANHNGGNLAFGPDGFLYIGMGDGGGSNDPLTLAQNPQSFHGKMLRIDVSVSLSDSKGYTIPVSNPFASTPGVLGEIWSVGLRNPWRWSFDDPRRGGTGALVIADVGQSAWEEIDYEPAGPGGRNYGWPIREGAHGGIGPSFPMPFTEPIFEYSHQAGLSITGGFVYRGSALGLTTRGRYFFADFVLSRVWSIQLTVNPLTRDAIASDLREHTAELGAGAQSPSSFGVDANGELYIVNYSGSVHRISSTVPLPVSPHRRASSVPVTGWAEPRVDASPVTSATPSTRAEHGSAPSVILRRQDSHLVLFVLTDKGWLEVDLSDEPTVRRWLRYVLAGSMSTEIWRHRP